MVGAERLARSRLPDSESGGSVVVTPSEFAKETNQDTQANRPGSTFLISFIPFAVVWNQTLILP